jgi:hypothetical protein
MPILDLQQRLVEAGRIRTGGEKPERGPGRKLETFRLTSRDEVRVRAAAELYGGTPEQWRDEWQVYTEADTLDVLVIPGQALSQWYELWEGGECKRRCDGRQQADGSRCECPADYDERREHAAKGAACKPTTRLSVVLPRVPGIGQWRLESHGFYAAQELAASAGLLEQATARGILLPARLRLDQRSSRRGGKTHRFAVPVLEIDASLEQVNRAALGAGRGEVLALPEASESANYMPAEAQRGPSPAEALDALEENRERPRRGRAEPIGQRAPAPEPKPMALDEEDVASGAASVAAGAAGPGASSSSSAKARAVQRTREMDEAEGRDIFGAPLAPEENVPAEGPADERHSSVPAAGGGERPADSSGASGDAAPSEEGGSVGESAVSGAASDLGEPERSPASSEERKVTDDQRRLLFRRGREYGLSEDEVRDVIEEVTDQRSTAAIPMAKFDAVLALLAVRGQEKQGK